MGMTIAYRGQIADLTRIEDFEDRLLDLALELDGLAQVWRSSAEGDARRMVRGVILDLAPGQESTSLLISPEGWLIGLADIEDAELSKLPQAPWCFVKTQFGPVQGHVALVELLASLQREFVPNLEVRDEGGYWETRDLAALVRTHTLLQDSIEGLAAGLRRHALSREAAEDPEILMQRVQRIAELVRRTLRRPSEHPPVTWDDDEVELRVHPDEEEAKWDAMYKHQRRMQERMQRAIDERLQRGEKHEEAFESALRDVGLTVPGEESGLVEEDGDELPSDWLEEAEDEADENLFAAATGDWSDADEDGNFDDGETSTAQRHPLLQRAMDLLHRLHILFSNSDPQRGQQLRTLFQGAGDVMGGLAQALSIRDYVQDDFGLCLTQLKRALRGAAFARGALYPLQSVIADDTFEELQRTLQQMERDIFQELGRLRSDFRRLDEADGE